MLFHGLFRASAPSREVQLGLTQTGDGRVIEKFGDFHWDVRDEPQLAGIDHRAEDGRNQVSGVEGVSHRFAAHAVGLTDHAAAVEAATE